MLQYQKLIQRKATEFFADYLLTENDFICLCETWLNDAITESELLLSDYQCYPSNRKFTNGNTAHGGIIICVKRSVLSEQHYLVYDVNGSLTICSLTLGERKLLILSCYLPPAYSKYSYNSDYLTKLLDNISQLKQTFSDIFNYGDLDSPTINWNKVSSDDDLEREFIDYINSMGFQQKIDFNTAASGLLDLLLVTKTIRIVNIEKINDCLTKKKFSNHSPFEFLFNVDNGSNILRLNPKQIHLVFAMENTEVFQNSSSKIDLTVFAGQIKNQVKDLCIIGYNPKYENLFQKEPNIEPLYRLGYHNILQIKFASQNHIEKTRKYKFKSSRHHLTSESCCRSGQSYL